MTPPDAPLLSVSGLCVRFPSAGGVVRAVEGVSFELRRGETLGLVGESGSGKSTTARAIVGLVPVAEGSVRLDGTELVGAPAALRRARPRLQMVFQDPYASLNPRMTVSSIVGEPLVVHRRVVGRAALDARVCRLLETVGLDASLRRRYPHEFSGGQRQRIGLARALALEPDVILLDEPVSALDVSVQAQVLNLLEDLRRRLGLTYLFIAHNLGVVRHVSDRIAVMYLGRLVELADKIELFTRPRHPYTRMLLDAIPDIHMSGRERNPVQGEVPNPLDPPSGCSFHPRCPHANERCTSERPLQFVTRGAMVACHAVQEGRIG